MKNLNFTPKFIIAQEVLFALLILPLLVLEEYPANKNAYILLAMITVATIMFYRWQTMEQYNAKTFFAIIQLILFMFISLFASLKPLPIIESGTTQYIFAIPTYTAIITTFFLAFIILPEEAKRFAQSL